VKQSDPEDYAVALEFRILSNYISRSDQPLTALLKPSRLGNQQPPTSRLEHPLKNRLQDRLSL